MLTNQFTKVLQFTGALLDFLICRECAGNNKLDKQHLSLLRAKTSGQFTPVASILKYATNLHPSPKIPVVFGHSAKA